MAVKVIDASALAAFLFGEPDAKNVIGEIKDYALAAPVLLSFELANVCLTKQRRHPTKREQLLASFHVFERMAIRYVDIQMVQALVLAEERKLTVYDASYLLLALQLGAPLVTLDKRLANAANKNHG